MIISIWKVPFHGDGFSLWSVLLGCRNFWSFSAGPKPYYKVSGSQFLQVFICGLVFWAGCLLAGSVWIINPFLVICLFRRLQGFNFKRGAFPFPLFWCCVCSPMKCMVLRPLRNRFRSGACNPLKSGSVWGGRLQLGFFRVVRHCVCSDSCRQSVPLIALRWQFLVSPPQVRALAVRHWLFLSWFSCALCRPQMNQIRARADRNLIFITMDYEGNLVILGF